MNTPLGQIHRAAVYSISHLIENNFAPTFAAVKDGYNEHQSRYPEDRNDPAFPIRLYGYQIESGGLGFEQAPSGSLTLKLHFSVKPMPYAFDGADNGVSEAACRAIALDIKQAIFRWSPVTWDESAPASSAKKLIEHFVNHGNEKPVDLSKYNSIVFVVLGRPFHGRLTNPGPTVTCEIPLESPEK